jgi:hypothetical protein
LPDENGEGHILARWRAGVKVSSKSERGCQDWHGSCGSPLMDDGPFTPPRAANVRLSFTWRENGPYTGTRME